jgi:hypothetical protein
MEGIPRVEDRRRAAILFGKDEEEEDLQVLASSACVNGDG